MDKHDGGAKVADVSRIEKPWGYELHWAKTENYVGKVIHVIAGQALSLQYTIGKKKLSCFGLVG